MTWRNVETGLRAVGNVTGWPTRAGRGCGLPRARVRVAKVPPATNPHPQRGLPKPAAGSPLGHGFPFFDIFDICLLHRCATQTSCRCKLPRFFCGSTSVNCRSKQVLHIDQRNFSQSTNCAINNVFRVMNFLVSDPQHIPFKPIK